MSRKLFLGNLPFSATEEDVKDYFIQHAPVYSVKIVIDRETGRSRGFGFIEMPEDAAEMIMEKLNGALFNGRTLRIGEARERQIARPVLQ